MLTADYSALRELNLDNICHRYSPHGKSLETDIVEKLPNRNIAKTRQPYNNHQYPIYYWHIAKFQKC
jgi:hypothetical protein